MPISRYQIRNVYSLADPELYKAADKDDPEALLEGVAMAGLVGVLRQLGDLAEFAAEIFHDLHEQVMATASRGHGLLVRVQQLESEFPSIERAFLSQTRHSEFFPNSGIDWHPNRQVEQNLITKGDLPRFVMDSYEECRGPPRLFLLDKFDVAGAGACLKRYTDPSFYKVEASSYELASAEAQRDKKIRKIKKRGSRWKGGETPDVSQPSHSKLHQLFLEERVQSGAIEPARRVKLKKRPNKFPFDSESGNSYMEKLLNSPSEDKLVHEVPVHSSTLGLASDNSDGSKVEVVEDSMVASALGLARQSRSPCVSPSAEKTVCGDHADNFFEKVAERRTSELPASSRSFDSISSAIQEEVHEKHIAVDGESKTDALQNGYASDDVASETDNYVDALATMESELETDAEFRAKTDPSINQETYSDVNVDQLQSQLSGSQSVGNSAASDDENSPIRKEKTSFSYDDNISTSAENTPPVDVDLPPQASPHTEIPFHPRVPSDQVSVTEKIPVLQQNSTASDDMNSSIRKEITSFSNSDTASNSSDSPVGADSPPQAFAGTEIPFHPRVPANQVSVTEKIPVIEHPDQEISSDTCTELSTMPNLRSAIDSALHVDQATILEETTSKEENLNEDHHEILSGHSKSEDHQIDLEVTVDYTSKLSDFSTADNLSSLLSVRDPEGEVDSEHPNDSSSPIIHLPNILETTSRISENSLSEVNQFECAEDNHTTGSVDSQCSSPHSVILLAEEQPFGPSLPECDICDPDVKHGDTIFSDDIPVAEETADTPDTYSLHKQQLKEVGDDIVHTSNPAEARVTFSSEDETKSNNSEIKVMVGAVSEPADAYRNEGTDCSVLKYERELEEGEIGSVNSESKVGVGAVSVPDDVETSDGRGLFAFEDDTELEGRKAESVNSETETRVAVLRVDFGENEDNGLSALEEPDESGSVINQLYIIQNSKGSDEKKEVDQHLLISSELDCVPCDTSSYDSSGAQLLDSILDSSLATCADVNDDVDSPFANSKILLNRSNSIIEETDQNGQQEVVLRDFGSQPCNTASSDVSNVQLLDGAPGSTVFTEADHDLESKSLDHADQAEAHSSLEDKVDQPPDQHSVESPLASGGSGSLSQLDSLTHVDHETHFDTHVEPCSVNLASQHVVQEDLESEPMTAVVATPDSTHLQDLQSSHESYLVPVSGKPPMSEIPQANHHEVNLSDQVKPSSTPVFSGFGILPQLAPVNLEEMPPLPPLPPMQWRMRKLQNDSLTPGTDGGQHIVDHFPTMFPSKADEVPQAVGHPSLDENRNPSNLMSPPDRENQKSQHAYEDLRGGMGSSGQILLPEATLFTEERDNSSVSSELKLPENFGPQPAVEKEQPLSVPTTSGQEIFWPSSSPYALPPTDDERPNGIRPMKIQRPRSPLIDAVAAHDKSKLRKVSERATSQILKEEETDNLLEQIRTKSFNLKPAVQTRPSIQGPKTNLRVAAILEKANAIRQAFAGSDDDDDDSDSWSDS